ncbi:uncharacterized protein CC84DRAFT_593033 [Paraphaeosphaeria sporulosa]|uniref:Uncharacterized protein n=1 Tax=Paraphaeosphaeria sporulosa TaxID=1460663 RepID=A0A177CPQ7_9PLEO|nr:uncharacterized protein CC84DRAFT_593033 [Paraphaeosphaeria sporulosa]OAG08860.1 hypothetical protein CC84DRAFT_593033 [Paraphaeosphaeria sporulosa]
MALAWTSWAGYWRMHLYTWVLARGSGYILDGGLPSRASRACMFSARVQHRLPRSLILTLLPRTIICIRACLSCVWGSLPRSKMTDATCAVLDTNSHGTVAREACFHAVKGEFATSLWRRRGWRGSSSWGISGFAMHAKAVSVNVRGRRQGGACEGLRAGMIWSGSAVLRDAGPCSVL